MGAAVRAATHDILDVLFPISCMGCGTYGEWLCLSCRLRIQPARPRCVACDAYSPTGRTCPSCSTRTPIAGVIAVGSYADPRLRAAIVQLKFKGVRALAEPLGELLARRISATGVHAGGGISAISHVSAVPTLVPVPLHRRRERKRGFNQARLLAEAVSRLLDLPVECPLLRTRSTSPQTSIVESQRARRRNVAGAFTLANFVDCSSTPRVILVDDVLTTSATLTEAARVLTAAGVLDIWAAVVARR